MVCRICGNSKDNQSYSVKEMMFGTRDTFTYFQCDKCGCLQIAEIPEDISAYYPSDYFSFAGPAKPLSSGLRKIIYSQRVLHGLGTGGFGGIFSLFAKPIAYIEWLKRAGLDSNARVLDVGCGHGKLLRKMHLGGMKHLNGIDPFIPETITYTPDFKIYKADLAGAPEQWRENLDLVMFHHSFEHLADPLQELLAAKRLLSPKGVILIRIPVADSFAWHHYRENWFQLDAPRHYYLHTDKSMEVLCGLAGLEIFYKTSVGESGQFVGSELYKQGIAMKEAEKNNFKIGRQQRRKFKKMTRRLNSEGEGDQTIFYLRARSD